MKKKNRNKEKTQNYKNGVKMVVDFFKKEYSKYIFGILAIILADICAIYTPIISGNIVDGLKSAESVSGVFTKENLFTLCLAIVLIALLKLLANFLTRFFILRTAYIFEYSTRNKLFRKLLDLSVKYYSKKTPGEIIALSSNDLGSLSRALGMGLMNIFNTLILLVISATYISSNLDLRLMLVVLIPFPLLFILVIQFGKVIHSRFKNVQESYSDMSGMTEECISGIRVVKSFHQEKEQTKKFEDFCEKNYEANVRLAKVQAMFHPLLAFISNLAYFIMLIYGGILAMEGKISMGEFVTVNGFLGMLVRPIAFMGMIINFLQRGKVSLERLSELLFTKPEIFDGNVAATIAVEELPKKLSGDIKIKNLSYKFDDKDFYSLKDINLEIKSGETIGVIGEIGSGKSTLVNLLIRELDSKKEGEIEFDGVDITKIPLNYLRDNIGYVPQENFLFSNTISYNINFAEQMREQSIIEEAAKQSKIHENIMDFDEQYDTLLGEKGVNISGGQKQRLCIARALIRKTPIMIFDDCLSSVDVETEKDILASLKDVREGRTCIIIAHRISTIKDANKIIVLDNGKIVEAGSHDELMKVHGIYYKTYKLQLMEDEVL